MMRWYYQLSTLPTTITHNNLVSGLILLLKIKQNKVSELILKKITMAIFEHKHFGAPISKELSNYIIYNQNHGDIKEIAEKHSYNPITLTAIVRGNRNLTESNSPMVIDLFRRCMANYNKNQANKESINDLILKAQ